ncbi:hypothetical protein ABNG03_00165 [Halorubrum sp. RMP-47]|uniref:Uncharacterized protein n=1 Tax=Halorubrum miltondacostae TaxID=3076378 RepID=A0ABD5M6M9_9EURY
MFFKNGDTNTFNATSADYGNWYKWQIDIDWGNNQYSVDWNNGEVVNSNNSFDGSPNNLAKLAWGAFGSNMNGSFDHYQDDYRVRL